MVTPFIFTTKVYSHKLSFTTSTILRNPLNNLDKSNNILLYHSSVYLTSTTLDSKISSSRDRNTDTDNDNDNGNNNDKEEEKIPSIYSLRDDIKRWSKEKSFDAPKKTSQALRQMFKYYYNNPIGNRKNNQKKEKGTEDEIIITEYNDKNKPPTINVIDCTQVIKSWGKSRQKDAPQQCMKLLKYMIALYQKDGKECIRPNVFTYTAVMNVFAQRGDYDGALQVFQLQLNDYNKEQNLKAKPNVITFNALIKACSKSHRDDMPEIAEKLLATINKGYLKGELENGPDIFTYSNMINCWAKSNRPDGPSRALDILDTIIATYKEDWNKNMRPNIITFNSVLTAYARQGDINGANKVFTMMKDDSIMLGESHSKPDLYTYNTLIDAWSKSNKSNAPMEAESLLLEIIDSFIKGEQPKGPDIITYNTVINCWSKSNRFEGPSRALAILQSMIATYNDKDGSKNNIRPNTITYSTVMDAYAKQDNVDGANKVFDMMKEDFYSGNRNAKPNIQTFIFLIDAWSKSNDLSASKASESLLTEMIDLYSKGILTKGPDTATYNTVIDCLSKSNRMDGPSRALNILTTMIATYKENGNKEDVRPDTITYSAVMDAYAKVGDVDGTNKVFSMMKKDYYLGNIHSKPNIVTYTILMDSWANNIDSENNKNENVPVDEVETILQEIYNCYDNGELNEGPNKVTYTTMIKCLKKYEGTEDRVRELKMLL